jgi:hypothetical protein
MVTAADFHQFEQECERGGTFRFVAWAGLADLKLWARR